METTGLEPVASCVRRFDRDAFRTVSAAISGFSTKSHHPQVRSVPLFPPRFFCSWVRSWVKTQASFSVRVWQGALIQQSRAFLTEYAELGKMQLGAARTAGGWLHHPKGGAAYANHITYWSLYGDNHCEKQKPPLWQVTVSMGFAHKPIYSLGS